MIPILKYTQNCVIFELTTILENEKLQVGDQSCMRESWGINFICIVSPEETSENVKDIWELKDN